jgi:dihydrofolate reductase
MRGSHRGPLSLRACSPVDEPEAAAFSHTDEWGGMKKLVAITMVSFDGVMQAPGGPDEDTSGGFEHGGWTAPFADDEFLRITEDWISSASGFVLGRKTYDIFAGYWPKHDDAIANALNNSPKYVASRSAMHPAWQHAVVLQGEPVEAIRKLKNASDGELQIHGSGNLIQTLHGAGLIDEYRTWVFPVVLGKGKRLFEADAAPRTLELQETRTLSSGVVLHVLRNAGEVEHGTVEVETIGGTKQTGR